MTERIAWTVEGPDWKEEILAPESSSPTEIATKVVETLNEAGAIGDNFSLGMILMVSHEKMTSIDGMYVCYTPTILANAGLYVHASGLQQNIDNLLKQ
jgi:hypothetical protein